MINITKEMLDDILEKTKENIEDWYAYFSENIQDGRADAIFLLEEQWDSIERQDYDDLGKPRLTYNKLYAYVKQLIGEARQNTPNLAVRSLNNVADQEAINLREGLIRTIAYKSKNDIVYETAFENTLIRSYGAIKVITDYEGSQSFDQEIKLQTVYDATHVFFDPSAVECDKSDGDFSGSYEQISKKEFEKKYPRIKYPRDFTATQNFSWGDDENIAIADYSLKIYDKKKIAQLSDGRVIEFDEAEELVKESKRLISKGKKEGLPILPPLKIVRERQTTYYEIYRFKMIENQILEYSRWPSEYLPEVFVDGDSFYLEGRQITKSYVRFARDAQRFLNYALSETAQSLKNSHTGKYILTPSNLAGLSQQDQSGWKNPEKASLLKSNPDGRTGRTHEIVPPTQLSPALMQIIGTADANIESILGRYGAAKGAMSQEMTGVAVNSKIRQGNLTAYTYFDNLARAIEQTGRIILDLLPHIYDTQRMVTLTMRDGSQKQVMINQVMNPMQKKNEIDKNKYDIVVTSGPSFEIQKVEALQQLNMITGGDPNIRNMVIDLMAENLNLVNTNQVVNRLQNLVPPQILAEEKGEKPQPPPPNPELQIQQQEAKARMVEAQASMVRAKADMENAQRKQEESAIKGHATRVRAGAEVAKAHTEYAGTLAKTVIDARNEGLKHENEQLKRENAALKRFI